MLSTVDVILTSFDWEGDGTVCCTHKEGFVNQVFSKFGVKELDLNPPTPLR